MKTLKILTANHMKSRDLAISNKEGVAEGAEVQIPIYTVVVHGIHTKSIDLSKMDESKQRIILTNTRTVPCTAQKIRRISWISRAHEVKARSSIIIELTDPQIANAFMERGMVHQDRLHECELYSPESKVRQCFNCQEYGHIGTRCYRPRNAGGAHSPILPECMTKDTRDNNGKDQTKCANCDGNHEA